MTNTGVVLGDYVLNERIARGGMAEVWSAQHRENGARVAVKLIKTELVAAEIFEREIQTVAMLNHPGVIRIYDYGLVPPEVTDQTRGRFPEHAPWFAMEIAEHATLESSPPTSYRELYHVVAQVLEALAHAHARGFVHRDIKPENLLITGYDGSNRPIVKISDFGIARSQYEGRTRVGTESAGTPRYMPPEQFMGKTHLIGPSSDFYALGCVALEWVNQRALFDGLSNPLQLGFKHVNDPLPELSPAFDVPIGFPNWLARMTHKVVSQRFTFAAQSLSSLPAPMKAPITRESRLVWDSSDTAGSRPATSRNLFHLQEIPLFGREIERETLRDALFKVRRQDRPASVVLRGSAGVGKSRLAEWFAQRAHELGAARYLRVNHAEVDRRDAISRAVATYFRCVGKPRDLAKARLFESLGNAGQIDLDTLVDVMQPFLDIRDEDVIRSPVPERLRDFTLISVLGRMAETRPLIVWLDDAHWGADSLRLVDTLLGDEVSDLPVLVVATVRDDALSDEARVELERLVERENAEALSLDPLSDEEQSRLVEHLVEADRRVIDDVVEQSSGIPLRAIHQVGDWLESGVVEPRAEGFVAPSDEMVTLDHVRPADLWRARFDESLRDFPDPLEARRALEIAAAVGRVVHLEEWTQALDVAGVRKPPGLVERLVGRRLARWTGEDWQFLHGDLSDTIRESAIEAGRWRDAHLACAEALAKTGSDRSHEMRARIARHQRKAGKLSAAFSNLVLAARIALHAEHQEAAIGYRRTLLELSDELGIGTRDQRRGWLAYFSIAANANRRPLAQTEEHARVLIGTARQCRWYEVLAFTHEVLMLTLAGQGKHDQAILAGHESIQLFDQLGESRSAARVQGAMAQMLLEAGLTDEAVRLAYASLEEAERLGDHETVARALDRLGRASVELERLEDAREHYSRGLELARGLGMRELEASIIDGLANVSRREDRFDDAIEGYRQAAALYEMVQSRSMWVSKYNYAMIMLLQGDWDVGVEMMGEALAVFEEFGLHSYALLARAALGTVAAHSSDLDLAEEHWSSVEQGFRRSPFFHLDLVWFCGVTRSSTHEETLVARCEKIARRTKKYRVI